MNLARRRVRASENIRHESHDRHAVVKRLANPRHRVREPRTRHHRKHAHPTRRPCRSIRHHARRALMAHQQIGHSVALQRVPKVVVLSTRNPENTRHTLGAKGFHRRLGARHPTAHRARVRHGRRRRNRGRQLGLCRPRRPGRRSQRAQHAQGRSAMDFHRGSLLSSVAPQFSAGIPPLRRGDRKDSPETMSAPRTIGTRPAVKSPPFRTTLTDRDGSTSPEAPETPRRSSPAPGESDGYTPASPALRIRSHQETRPTLPNQSNPLPAGHACLAARCCRERASSATIHRPLASPPRPMCSYARAPCQSPAQPRVGQSPQSAPLNSLIREPGCTPGGMFSTQTTDPDPRA